MRRPWTLVGIGLLALTSGLLTGCSSDGDGGSDGVPAPTTAVDDGGTSTDGGGAADDRPVAALTAAELCDGVSVEVVAGATGLDITGAEPPDQLTPQCSYAYSSPSGATSNLTVASMRPEDVGDRSVAEAYDYVVELNHSSTSGTEVEVGTPDAGDRATRLTGASLHLGIVTVDDHLLTVVLPADDVDGAAADALVVAVAAALA